MSQATFQLVLNHFASFKMQRHMCHVVDSYYITYVAEGSRGRYVVNVADTARPRSQEEVLEFEEDCPWKTVQVTIKRAFGDKT